MEKWFPGAARDNETERRRKVAHDLFGFRSSRISREQVEIKVDVGDSRPVGVISANDTHRSLERGVHDPVEAGKAAKEWPQAFD